MRYVMTLTEEQYNHIALCVETCHRIACGELDALNTVVPNVIHDEDLRRIKETASPELGNQETYKWNGGYRDKSSGEPFRKAFDEFQARGYQIYRQMRHKQVIAKGIDNIYTTPTLATDKAEQPNIEVINE